MSEATTGAYRFIVTREGATLEILKTLLTLAIRETELIFGRARRKLEADYELSSKKPICTIPGGTECGEHLAKLLSGFLIKQIGEDGFRVERLSQWKKSA